MHFGKVGVEPTLTNLRLLVIGKTGNGKSSLCNALLGSERFQTGRSMSSTTLKMQYEETVRDGIHYKVVDTPDLINCEMTDLQMKQEVSAWKAETTPHPSLILLAIRCDVRYTREEYDIYANARQLLGQDSVKEKLVVAFTFGDRQDGDIGEQLKTVCRELQNVLRDAGGRYVVYNEKAIEAEKKTFVKKVEQLATRIENATTRPRSRLCNKDDRFYLPLLILLVPIVVITILLAYVFGFEWAAIGMGVFGIMLAGGLLVVFLTLIWKSKGSYRFPTNTHE